MSQLAGQQALQVQHLECRRLLSGEPVVENNPPTIATPLYDVTVNSGASPRLIDLQYLFADSDTDDQITITVLANTDSDIVTATVNDNQLLLVFSGSIGTAQITLVGTDSQGESASSTFDVNVKDSGSSITARVAGVSTVGEVGTVNHQLSRPDILHDWESALLEIWYQIGSDTPDVPFNLDLRVQARSSFFEAPTVHAALGNEIDIQSTHVDAWHATLSTIVGLDLSGYQLGDQVLIATYRYQPNTGNGAGLSRDQGEGFPSLNHAPVFQVAEAEFVGGGSVVVESLVPSRFAPVVYDANNDGRIGLADFALFITGYGKGSDLNSARYDASAAKFDFNRDGKVGIADFSMFLQYYGDKRGIDIDFDLPGLTSVFDEDEVPVTPSAIDIVIQDSVDFVFDDANQILYVTTAAGHLERWNYKTQTLLSRYENITSSPAGFDVTMDGRFAYIGDALAGSDQGIVWKVDLADGTKTALNYELDRLEGGVHHLVISADGKAFFTTIFYGSGWNPLHVIDLETDVISDLMDVRQSTGIARGADRSLLFFQEYNSSAGPIFTYDAKSHTFTEPYDTGGYVGNVPTAISPDAKKIAFGRVLMTSDLESSIVGDRTYHGIVFDTNRPLLYGIDIETDEVLVFDSRDLQILRCISIGANVDANVNVSISSQSQHLFVSTPSGIRQIETQLPGANLNDMQAPTGQVIRVPYSADQGTLPWITIQFNEPVRGLTIDDFQLTRDSGNNLLTGGESVFTVDGGQTWILLGVPPLTTVPGTYLLQVEATGSSIEDLNGNLLSREFFDVWTHDISTADDVILPFPGVRDQVYDENRGILYISTQNGSLHRWDVVHQKLLKSFDNIATLPSGLDITPDGRYAYMGEEIAGISQGIVWKVDLDSGEKKPIRFSKERSERGVFDLEISADGRVFFTTDYAGSGSTPLRFIEIATDSVREQFHVRQNTSITRGADRSVLFFQQSNSSGGPIFTYHVDREAYTGSNVGWYIGSLPDAVSADGQLIAFLGDIVDPIQFTREDILLDYAVGYAFDPRRPLLFNVLDTTDQIVAYDPASRVAIASFDINEDLDGDFVEINLNEDASLAFLTTSVGIRQMLIDLPDTDIFPPYAQATDVLPVIRYDAIDSLRFQFNEVVTGVTIDDFQLTRDHGANLLSGTETVYTIDGGKTWVVEGFNALNQDVGQYSFQLNAASSLIQDEAGNSIVRDVSTSWEIIRPVSGGELIPIEGYREQVTDEVNNILYITTDDGTLHRWDVQAKMFLDSFEEIAQSPRGLDITPDGRYAFIGEEFVGPNGGIIWKVDLTDGTKIELNYELERWEEGIYDLAVTSNNKLFFTTEFDGSGWTPLHKMDLTTGEILNLQQVRHRTQIDRSADHTTLFFRENGTSIGPLFTYDAEADVLSDVTHVNVIIRRFPAAVNRDGTLLAFREEFYDADDLSSVRSMGQTNIGAVAFDPTSDLMFIANTQMDMVYAFDPETLIVVWTFAIGENISDYVDMSVSADGKNVFVKTPSGIRSITISIPPDVWPSDSFLEGESIRFDTFAQPLIGPATGAFAGKDSEKKSELQSDIYASVEEISVSESDLYAGEIWQRQLEELYSVSTSLHVDRNRYACAVDDLFDHLEEAELERLLD